MMNVSKADNIKALPATERKYLLFVVSFRTNIFFNTYYTPLILLALPLSQLQTIK